MSDRAPDSASVEREHVLVFLDWYRGKVKLPKYVGFDDHWINALHTLNMGELRNGMRRINALSKPQYFGPSEFWHICKNKRPPIVNKRFHAMRELLKQGDIK